MTSNKEEFETTHLVELLEESRRQSRSLSNDPAEQDLMDWLESVSDLDGWH